MGCKYDSVEFRSINFMDSRSTSFILNVYCQTLSLNQHLKSWYNYYDGYTLIVDKILEKTEIMNMGREPLESYPEIL